MLSIIYNIFFNLVFWIIITRFIISKKKNNNRISLEEILFFIPVMAVYFPYIFLIFYEAKANDTLILSSYFMIILWNNICKIMDKKKK